MDKKIKRIYYTDKNYEEFMDIKSEEYNQFDKCGTVLKNEEMVTRKNPTIGIAWSHICPNCGHDEFLIFK